ncbi:MAG: GGDEF domain-containing protein [Treponema sp.]|uniref:GGDEF domain-containing protein n=1 Tax=Treponema sp. TaxID=166 RepID=UPI001B56E134|nr:GGDEF domain-containing protein [Treponema sp.]MBP5402233.1 GGDEF domain-containing protein [Treponema sp.]MBR5933002.1 GGDEF domain-containing protein [Treponema sp.]
MKTKNLSYRILANPFPFICYIIAVTMFIKNIIYVSNYDVHYDPILIWGTLATIAYFTLGILFRTKHKFILFLFYVFETCLRAVIFTSILKCDAKYEVIYVAFFAVFYLFSEYFRNREILFIGIVTFISATAVHTFIYKTVFYKPILSMSSSQLLFSQVESFSNLTLASVQLIIISIYVAIVLKKMYIKNDVTQKKLEYITRHDILTGLMNRYRAFTIFSNCESRKLNEGIEYGIAILDIDDFKKVNDNYGHGAGDFILKSYTQELRKRLPLQNKIARWGGEEFLIIFPKITSETIFELDTIRELLSLTVFHYNNQIIHVTATYGISSSKNFSSAIEVLDDADKHLYIGKQNGKNRLVVSEKF